jgi:hypothetical protein
MKVHQEHMKEPVGTGEIKIEYVKTSLMLVDILTKPLGGDHYQNLVNLILSFVPYSSNRGAKRKTLPRQTEEPVTELAKSLTRLNCSHQGTSTKKHKSDSQNPLGSSKKQLKK